VKSSNFLKKKSTHISYKHLVDEKYPMKHNKAQHNKKYITHRVRGICGIAELLPTVTLGIGA
jgi:hypothetical protein